MVETRKIVFSAKDNDANDEFGFPGIGDFVLEAIKNYDKNSPIESFIRLHGAIEVIMFNIWVIFLVKTLDKKFESINEFSDFKTNLKILKQIGFIDHSLYSKLQAFKKGRDAVSHFMTNQFLKKKINSSALLNQFNDGIDSYKRLIVIRQKLITN